MANDKNKHAIEPLHEDRDTTFARWHEASRANDKHAIEQLHEDRVGVTFALWQPVWQGICSGETPSRQEVRTVELISDEKILGHLWEVADLPPQQIDKRTARIDSLVRFIEEVAALPDKQPPGSHLRRDAGEPLTFSTPKVLKQNLGKAHTTAGTLIDVITRTATTLQAQFPLRDACQLIDLLERFSAEAVHVSAIYAEHQQIDTRAKTDRRGKKDFETPTEGTPVSPGSTAGKNGGRNWLLQTVGQLAAVHLGVIDEERAKEIRPAIRALCREVTRALMGCEKTINERTALDHLPPVTLIPADGPLKLDDWRKEIGK